MDKILHKVKAMLYLNWLTEDPNDYVARVVSERSLTISDICRLAVARGGATQNAEDLEHSVGIFLKEMTYQLCDGFSVNTGYFTATPLIKGVFNSPTENFNASKHSVLFQFNQGETLRRELSNVGVEITGVGESSTEIAQVTDVKSNSVNDQITPNRNLRIKGYKLRVAGDHADVGIYFVNTATGARIKVPADDIVTNNPSELVIMVPTLPKGAYTIEITTQFSNSKALVVTPRKAVFEKILTVN